MAQNTSSAPARDRAGEAESPEIIALLGKVDALLKENLPQKALALIGGSRFESPWLKNAIGVCQLRLGHIQAAVELFRGMVVSGHLDIRHDAPTVWKTNFATALLLTNNLSGCMTTLAEIKDQGHPSIQKLRTAIDCWKNSLTFWQKVLWYTGSEPPRPVELDFPPGDLE